MATKRKNPHPGKVRDKKTGQLRAVDPKRSAAAKKGAAKRRGKPLKAATKMKIKAALKKTHASGRTRSGRVVVKW